ncbi:MAG: ABC transporter ATP-binding protein [Dehalococcoidia bacterium]
MATSMTAASPSRGALQILLRLSSYVWRYRWRLLLTYLYLLGATALSLAIPRFLGTAIDAVLGSGSQGQLIFLAVLVLVISLARGALSYGQSYLGEHISQRVAYDLRNAIFDHLQRLSFGFHDQQKTGDLMSKATVDVESVRWFVNVGLVRSLFLMVLVVGVATLLLLMHWQLGLLSLVAVPIVATLATRLARKLRRIWTYVQQETGNLTTVLQENLSGVRVVKAFGGQEYEEAKFRSRARNVAQETFHASRLHSVNTSFTALVFAGVTGLVLWYGGREVLAGNLTPGQLTQFILYLGMLTFPVRMTGWIVNTFSRAISAGERIFQILDAESPVRERRNAREVRRFRGHVRFEEVSFHYNSQFPALQEVAFEVAPGQKVAVIGMPGSGKSTIAHLLPRFYDVTTGRITIDGMDIRDLTLASLRRNIGIVFQDIFLFSATIQENIAYGVPEASAERIVAAAKVAQLHDFIAQLPQGYQTWVGERGITLSGGQRQRLAIARTLLLGPPVLVLDDAISSVDTNTELLIHQALSEVMRGRTVFIIAHRLSSVREADLILVLQDGRIVERGTHRELLARPGFYREIYELQFRPQEQPSLLESPVAGDG